MGRVVGRPLGSRSKGIIELVSSAFFFFGFGRSMGMGRVDFGSLGEREAGKTKHKKNSSIIKTNP